MRPTPDATRTNRARGLRRLLAGALVGGAFAAQAPSCAAAVDPPSLINSLRVLSVTLDKPYAKPGETVRFDMRYFDGRETESFTPVTIVWIGGCENPPGNQYFGCYEQLGALFQAVAAGEIPPDGLIAAGPGLTSFEYTLSDTIVSEVAPPPIGPRLGIAYVFFVACAGELRPVEQDGETEAGSFPLGCFDSEGRQLGPEGYIPGYTQVYAFEDGRENQNPNAAGMLVDGELQPEGAILAAKVCPISSEDRRQPGCAAEDAFEVCSPVVLDVQVDESVAEPDPDAKDAEGNQLEEVVWVSYYSDAGDFDTGIKLLHDSAKGLTSDRSVEWVPPPEPGLYTLWAVVRDNRGGTKLIEHLVEVTE